MAIDLYCGLGGWTEGFLAEGFTVIGFDIERRPYPAQLVLQDVLTLHGSQFRHADAIVASPPCQAYSYRAMPWKRAKALPPPSNDLFDACFRIQREACEAAGRDIPMVVENVKGAQPWVGRAAWHYGSFYLWGDVPALMPIVSRGVKVPGMNWSGSDKPGYVAKGFNMEAIKNNGGSWFNIGSPGQTELAQNPVNGCKVPGFNFHEHEKTGQPGRSFQSAAVADTFGWSKDSPLRKTGSHSSARKAASAEIAKIPFELARHIAACFKPERVMETA